MRCGGERGRGRAEREQEKEKREGTSTKRWKWSPSSEVDGGGNGGGGSFCSAFFLFAQIRSLPRSLLSFSRPSFVNQTTQNVSKHRIESYASRKSKSRRRTGAPEGAEEGKREREDEKNRCVALAAASKRDAASSLFRGLELPPLPIALLRFFPFGGTLAISAGVP